MMHIPGISPEQDLPKSLTFTAGDELQLLEAAVLLYYRQARGRADMMPTGSPNHTKWTNIETRAQAILKRLSGINTDCKR